MAEPLPPRLSIKQRAGKSARALAARSSKGSTAALFKAKSSARAYASRAPKGMSLIETTRSEFIWSQLKLSK